MAAKIHLVIPHPVPQGPRAGLQGYEHAGKIASVRMTVDDYVLLAEEAMQYGMTASALMRWVTLHAVQQLRLQRTNEKIGITP
jgi:hypothetical protein